MSQYDETVSQLQEILGVGDNDKELRELQELSRLHKHDDIIRMAVQATELMSPKISMLLDKLEVARTETERVRIHMLIREIVDEAQRDKK